MLIAVPRPIEQINMSTHDDNEPMVYAVEINGVELYVLSLPLVGNLPDHLSKAEREVALLVLAGASNEEIAHHRGTAMQTVANQLHAIFRKMEVGSRAEFIAALDE